MRTDNEIDLLDQLSFGSIRHLFKSSCGVLVDPDGSVDWRLTAGGYYSHCDPSRVFASRMAAANAVLVNLSLETCFLLA